MKDATMHDWISSMTDVVAIKANQNGPKPTGLFLTWQLVSAVPAGPILVSGEIIPADEEPGGENGYSINQTYLRRYRETYSIDAWATGGDAVLDLLSMASEIQAARAVLAADGVTLIDVGPQRDLTKVLDARFMPHYQVDLTFYAYRTIMSIDGDGVVDVVDLDGTVETPLENELTVSAHAEREIEGD